MKPDAIAALRREAQQQREQIEAWKTWATRVLAESGIRNAHRIGPDAARTLIGELAKFGAAEEALTRS